MSKTDEHKKYITLDDVRVSYRKKDDTIHLTTTDSDVQAGGFHLSLNRGTQTEETLRDLLIEEGVIRSNVLIPPIQPNVFVAPPSKDYQLRNGVMDCAADSSSITLTQSKGGAGKTSTAFFNDGTVKQAKVISVVSTRGGAGKTNIALALAAGFQKTGLKTIVIDSDTRDGALRYYAETIAPSVLNFYLEENKTLENLKKSILHDKALGIDLLLSPLRARNADYLAGDFYFKITSLLKSEYDIIIFDTAVDNGIYDTSEGSVIEFSDIVLLVATLSKTSVFGMSRWVNEIVRPKSDKDYVTGGLGLDLGRVGVILNQTLPDMGADLGTLKHAAGDAKILISLPMENTIRTSQSTEKLAEAYKVKNEFNSSMKNLVRIVKNATA